MPWGEGQWPNLAYLPSQCLSRRSFPGLGPHYLSPGVQLLSPCLIFLFSTDRLILWSGPHLPCQVTYCWESAFSFPASLTLWNYSLSRWLLLLSNPPTAAQGSSTVSPWRLSPHLASSKKVSSIPSVKITLQASRHSERSVTTLTAHLLLPECFLIPLNLTLVIKNNSSTAEFSSSL